MGLGYAPNGAVLSAEAQTHLSASLLLCLLSDSRCANVAAGCGICSRFCFRWLSILPLIFPKDGSSLRRRGRKSVGLASIRLSLVGFSFPHSEIGIPCETSLRTGGSLPPDGRGVLVAHFCALCAYSAKVGGGAKGRVVGHVGAPYRSS